MQMDGQQICTRLENFLTITVDVKHIMCIQAACKVAILGKITLLVKAHHDFCQANRNLTWPQPYKDLR